jgi:hypothetical protein
MRWCPELEEDPLSEGRAGMATRCFANFAHVRGMFSFLLTGCLASAPQLLAHFHLMYPDTFLRSILFLATGIGRDLLARSWRDRPCSGVLSRGTGRPPRLMGTFPQQQYMCQYPDLATPISQSIRVRSLL